MKYLLLLPLLISGTLSAQVEHWKLNYSIGLDEPAEAEIYAARGKFYMSVKSGEMSSETFVDSAERRMLQLNHIGSTKEYTIFYFRDEDLPETIVRTAPDGTEYTVVPSLVPEREPQIEGVNFELLKDRKKKFGLVLEKAKLTFPELEMEAEGWIVRGKMIGNLTPYIFKNGDVGGVIESSIEYGGMSIQTELTLFEEVKSMPEDLNWMAIPEGYEDGDREEEYEYGDEESYYDDEYYGDRYEEYKPSGKPEPETIAAEHFRLSSTSLYDGDADLDIFMAPTRYRIEHNESYASRTTVVDSGVYWRMELEDHGFSYFRLEPFYASKANTDSLEKPDYITGDLPRGTAKEGEAFRLLGDTKNWNGLKLHHVAMLTWKDDWAQGDGWLLLRELPGLDDEQVFVLKDGRKGTLIEYDFYAIGPMSGERPDSLHPEMPDTALTIEYLPPSTSAYNNDIGDEGDMPVDANEDTDEEVVEGDWNIEAPEPVEDDWYSAWSNLRWDSSQEAFDAPLPEVIGDPYAGDATSMDMEYDDYDDSWRYPQQYKRKLLLYGKTVVSGGMFSLTPPEGFYDVQAH